ncbi:unnamed protein product [Orchesella dallaii]|uniref:UDP-glucuronosyltransferase n=1 Tax=Orchesella dallaii TaxID=48710 RepID=A0ABP1QRX2_9HEXA
METVWVCRLQFYIFFFLLASSSISVGGSNILFFHGVSTASHRTAIWPLAEKLADAGHNVTYIFPVTKRLGSHPRIEEFAPSKMVPLIGDFVSDFDINIRLNDQEMEWMRQAYSQSVVFCEAFYDSPEIQEWLARPDLHYDLVMLDALGECGYGLVHKFKAKHILFVPLLAPFLHDGFGLMPETSSIPELSLHYKPTELTFFNRVSNTLMILFWRYSYLDFIRNVEPVIKDKLNLTEFPPIAEFEKNTSLVLINNHWVEDYPISLPPMFVSFSGLGCKKEPVANPLPEKVSKFLEDADGFIYISFGSAVVASAMPISLRDEFFAALKSLPKLRFLWRWTGRVPDNTPENVLLLPWFPQHDILAHPKIKGFVTQAGRPSTQEALCYAVPLIAIPMFADQDYNADRMEYIGGAIRLDIKNISSALLQESIHELAYNPKHKERMVELSNMFKDRPIDPLDNAFYWTEYVLRYDTSLLKPLGINQTWYQRRLLDVYLFLFVVAGTVAGTVMFFTVMIFKYAFALVFSKQQKTKAE